MILWIVQRVYASMTISDRLMFAAYTNGPQERCLSLKLRCCAVIVRCATRVTKVIDAHM